MATAKPKDANADMLKPAEVMTLTGLSRSAVYKKIAKGDFDAVWTRGRVRVSRKAVEIYVAEKVKDAA